MSGQTDSPRSLARLVATALLTGALTLAGFLAAAPAAAHDELLSSDPAADATVNTLPAQLTLTFSGLLIDEEGATEVAVTDAGGASLTDGEPAVDGSRLTQRLTGTPTGAVTVLWKVVSSDTHAISGEYSFTVAAPGGTTGTDPQPPADEQQPAEDQPATPAAAEPGPMPWWVPLILVGIAVSGALLYLTVSRARRQRDH